MAGEYQMIVVCGKNEVVQKQLKSRQWPSNVNVVVNGFVANMDDWMVAADLMVTKAGPGTIAEAAIVGLPCMLSGFLPGQEEGNVPYVINAGYGDFSRDPTKISAKVTEWLGDAELVAKMSAAASLCGEIGQF
jgi:1,2-diacylglycerol 3-beta-galactosyltransferase